MYVLRTQEARFNDLSDYSFPPNYLEGLAGYQDFRIHYLDEGRQPNDAGPKVFYVCMASPPGATSIAR